MRALVLLQHLFVLLLLNHFINTQIIALKYNVRKNVGFNYNSSKIYLMNQIAAATQMDCLTLCHRNESCMGVGYNQSEKILQNCFLFNYYIDTDTNMTTSTLDLYNKLCMMYDTYL